MERLEKLMDEKGYLKKQKYEILRRLEDVSDNHKERAICAFMKFIEESEGFNDAVTKCTDFIYNLYGGLEVRTKILDIFLKRDYDVKDTNKVLALFGDIPFQEKENLAKRLLPIVVETEDFNLILKNAKQIVRDFKKEKNI